MRSASVISCRPQKIADSAPSDERTLHRQPDVGRREFVLAHCRAGFLVLGTEFTGVMQPMTRVAWRYRAMQGLGIHPMLRQVLGGRVGQEYNLRHALERHRVQNAGLRADYQLALL